MVRRRSRGDQCDLPPMATADPDRWDLLVDHHHKATTPKTTPTSDVAHPLRAPDMGNRRDPVIRKRISGLRLEA